MGRKIAICLLILSRTGQNIINNHSFSTHILFLTEPEEAYECFSVLVAEKAVL
jgi:hypothetical protein